MPIWLRPHVSGIIHVTAFGLQSKRETDFEFVRHFVAFGFALAMALARRGAWPPRHVSGSKLRGTRRTNRAFGTRSALADHPDRAKLVVAERAPVD
jgi:hypothetical protein